MPWIAKRPCKVVRNGKAVIVPPGDELPEAKDFTNPTMWCVWHGDPDVSKKSPTEKTEEKKEETDYMSLSIVKLRKMAKAVQKKTGDDTTDVKKADKPELIVIIKSLEE